MQRLVLAIVVSLLLVLSLPALAQNTLTPAQGDFIIRDTLLIMTKSPLQWYKQAPTREAADQFFDDLVRRQPALASLVKAERAFARTSVEKGIREAFLTFFADDGINFQPHPTNTKEAMRKRPALIGPSPVTLNWEPVYGDTSLDGDLGYTTGPYSLTDNTPEKRPEKSGA